jgi:hypothetical protein
VISAPHDGLLPRAARFGTFDQAPHARNLAASYYVHAFEALNPATDTANSAKLASAATLFRAGKYGAAALAAYESLAAAKGVTS